MLNNISCAMAMHSLHDWATTKYKATPITFPASPIYCIQLYSPPPINTYLRRALNKQSILRWLRPGPILYPLSVSGSHRAPIWVSTVQLRPEPPLTPGVSTSGSETQSTSQPHHNNWDQEVFWIIFPWVNHAHLYVINRIILLLKCFV